MTNLLTPQNTKGVNFQPKKYVGPPRHESCEYPPWDGGLVVSAMDSVSSGSGLSPGQGIVLHFWARHLKTLIIAPFFNQAY